MRPDTVVADRFVIESLAGKGGMSEVYSARDMVSGQRVAMKIFTDGDEEKSAERFAREVELLAALRHPAIVEHVAHGFVERSTPFLAMEWLEGEDLSERIARGPLSIDEVLTLAGRIASALSLAHARGVVHRDVKPSNIFLQHGEIAEAKILDFGIARVRGGPQFTRFGEALGTPAYMAPEQARGAGDIDVRADIFAFGCVLFECLIGRPPFWADHPLAVMAKILIEDAPRIATLRPEVPMPLCRLVERMLAKEPNDRPRDGSAIADLIAAMTSKKAVEAPAQKPFSDPSALTSRELQLLSVVFVGRVQAVAVSDQEAMNPTMLAEVSGEEIDRVLSEVLRHGGWAERLVDGSVVVTLPGRGLISDQAASAARCALAVQRAMPSHPMALVTGRADLTGGFPVGDVIVRGVHLLAAEVLRPTEPSAPRGIAIDDVAAGLLDRRFEIVGRTNGLALIGEREGGETLRTLLGRPQPFVGRDRELKRILSLYDTRVGDNAAQAVLVTAPAGVGKSRLGRELLAALEERQPKPVLIVGRGDADRQQVALGLVAGAIEQLFGLQKEGPEVDRHRVRVRVGRNVDKADRDRVAAFLGELVSVHFPPETHPLLPATRPDRVRLGDQIRAAWEDFMAAELAAGPVVILIEDLHYADAASVNLIDRALHTFADLPLFVIGLARPDVDETFPQLWPARPMLRFELPRLAPAAAAALARHALGDDASDSVVDRLVVQADGNAFYLEELVRAVAAGRGDRLPETVLAMVHARLEELDAHDRRVLRACSIFGDSFSVGAVKALLGQGQAVEVVKTLARLADAEILSAADSRTQSGEAELSFRSALLREAAYAMLTAEDRALGHRLAAKWLERSGADRDAIVVANHLERAGEERKAAVWYARAAEVALEGNDFVAAVERAERGAAVGASGPLLGRIRLLQGEAYRHLGDNKQLLQRAGEAMGLLPPRTPPWWDAAADAVLASLRMGQRDVFQTYIDQIMTPPLVSLPAGATRIARYLHNSGLHVEGDALLASAMQNIGSFAEDPSKWAWGYRAYAIRAGLAGDIGESAEQLDLAVRAHQASGDLRETAATRLDLGFCQAELGLYAAGAAALGEARAAAERFGLRHIFASSLVHLASIEARLGKFGAAHEMFARGRALFVEQKNRHMEAWTYLHAGLALADEGRFAEAIESAMAARTMFNNQSLVPYAIAAGASALLATGRTQEALAMVREAMDPLLKGVMLHEGESFVRLTYAQALLGAGQLEPGRSALTSAHERLVQRASRIRDPAWRRSFLENVPENAKTIEMVKETLRGA